MFGGLHGLSLADSSYPWQGSFPYMSAARAEAMVAIGGGVEHGQSSLGQPTWTLHHRRRCGEGIMLLARFASALLTTSSKHSKPLYLWKALVKSFQNHIGFAMFGWSGEECGRLVIFNWTEVVRV